MLNLADVLNPAPGVISRESEGELVVVLPEKGRYIVLNGTGANAFQLMDGQLSLGDIASILGERYDVPLERTQTDVLALAQKLLDRGVVCLQDK
jgi:fructose-1,6-bisphosphatase